MPSTQSKRVFVGGLDKDTDLRALKNGDYHHALNIRNVSSEANTEGVIENIKGNKKATYEFPSNPVSGRRRITLFMPMFNYFFNYGGVSGLSNQSVMLENFDGRLRDENDPYTYTVATSALDENGYPLGYNIFVEETAFPFPSFYVPNNVDNADDSVMNFDISIGFSLAEMQNPTNNFQIAYNGETHINMLNYLTFWVSQNQNSFANLGITVSVIDNNSPYFNNEYFFGQSTLNNIASEAEYTPGQVWAYALLFESDYSNDGLGNEEGLFYIDLKQSGSAQPLYLDAQDSITGSLFTADENGLSPYFILPENIGVEDGYGYANSPDLLNNSTDWSVVDISEGDLVLTEYANQIESVGWSVIFGENVPTGPAGQTTFLGKTIIKANATIVNDITDTGELISYSTIGAYEDTRNDKIYWFVASDHSFHLILEYDIKDNDIKTVFRDSGDANTSVFNWRKEFLINDIDMIGDKLYWTSPFYGEPKGINVRKSKNSIALMDAIVDTGVFTGLGAYTCVEQDPDTSYTVDGVTVYPSLADYYPYQLYDNNYPKSNKESYVEVIKPYKNVTAYYFYADDPSIKRNNVIEFSWQFRQRYHFYDKEVSAWGPASSLSFTSDTKKNSSIQASPGENNHIAVRTYYGNGEVEFIEICARKNSQNGDNRGDRKKGNQGEYFSIAKVKNNYKKWLENNDAYTYYHFYNDKIYSFISQLESDKNYDNVPKNALTQTLLGNNRLAYGNYFEGFDLPRLNVKLRPLYGYLHTNEFDINTTFYPFFTEDKDSKVSPDNTESSINSFGGVASGSAISSSDLYTTSANNLISILQSDLTGNFLEHLNYFNLSNPSSPEYQWLEGATEANNFTSTGSTEHWTEMQSADNVTGGTDALTAEGDIPGENGTDLNMVNYDFATVKSSNSSSVIANYTGSPNVGSQTNVSQLNSYDISETPTNNPLGSGFFTGSDAGGENNYPKIRLTFKMNFDEFVFRPNVRLKLKWAFKVQKEYRSGGDGWFDQTPTQVMDIDILIPQVPGNYT